MNKLVKKKTMNRQDLLQAWRLDQNEKIWLYVISKGAVKAFRSHS